MIDTFRSIMSTCPVCKAEALECTSTSRGFSTCVQEGRDGTFHKETHASARFYCDGCGAEIKVEFTEERLE